MAQSSSTSGGQIVPINVEPRWITTPSAHQGVVTGCDISFEWMLEWWYRNYSRHNKYPICFADFGMSRRQAAWCAERGTVLDLRFPSRHTWFKKPFAILSCPFERIVWMDIDCEVRKDIGQIFEYAGRGIAVTLDPHNHWVKSDQVIASGVVGVSWGNETMVDWAKACLHTPLRGDQEVLNSITDNRRGERIIMPPEYQWLRLDGDNRNAYIMHWTGSKGKEVIKRHSFR